MVLHLRITGAILIALAFIHIFFPKRFNWKDDLSAISLMNKQLMYVHTFFIALIVLLMGVLCVYSAEDIVASKLGRIICFGLAVFWTVRLIFQFLVYSPQLWRGKRFETSVHILFSLLWMYISGVFWVVTLTA